MVFEVFAGAIEAIFLFLLSGSFIALALFPKKNEIDFIERFLFSIVFGITLIPFFLFVESVFLKIPVNFASVFSTIAFIMFFGLIVYLARIQSIKAPNFFYKIFSKIEKEEAVFKPPSLLKK